MEYRTLGRTGVMVSPLCLGTMVFGNRTSENDSMAIIDRAIEQGINFIDTANVYNRGVSEEIVGKALARNGQRERIVLATKVHGTMADDDPNMRGNSRRHIIQQCEASLKRLQTDWIDLYQLHRPMPQIPIDEALRALDDLVRAGKVRYIGTSNFAAWQVTEALWVAKELGLNRFVSEQPAYHLMERRIERELVPMARTFGLAIIPWSPLAGGFLTGKYQKGKDMPKGTRWGNIENPDHQWVPEPAWELIALLETLAKQKGCSVGQLSLAWNMSQPGITAPIIGPRTMEQLEDNLGSIDVTVTDEDRKQLDAVSAPGKNMIDHYVSDFGPHPYRVMV